jgi:hypothetical protein
MEKASEGPLHYCQYLCSTTPQGGGKAKEAKMRLLFIHGVNNVHVTAPVRLQAWLATLIAGGTPQSRLVAADPVMADYAQILRDGRPQRPLRAPMPDDAAKLAFMARCTREMLASWQKDVCKNLASIDPVAEAPRATWLYGQLISGTRPPGFGAAVEVMDEIYDYLTKPALRQAIDAVVRNQITAGPMLILGHSMGAVIGWRLLRMMGEQGTDLSAVHFATLGAPFPNPVIRGALDAPFTWPKGLGSWINLYHPLDYVSLGTRFRLAGAGPQPAHARVATDSDDPHSVFGYLATRRLHDWLTPLLPSV